MSLTSMKQVAHFVQTSLQGPQKSEVLSGGRNFLRNLQAFEGLQRRGVSSVSRG